MAEWGIMGMKPCATWMAKLIHNLELLRRICVNIVHIWLPNHTFAEASTWKPLLYWHTYTQSLLGDDIIRTSNMQSSACFERKTGNKNHCTLTNNLGTESWAESLSFLTKLEQNPQWIFFNEIPIANSCQLVFHFFNEWKANLPWNSFAQSSACQTSANHTKYSCYISNIWTFLSI